MMATSTTLQPDRQEAKSGERNGWRKMTRREQFAIMKNESNESGRQKDVRITKNT